MKNITSIKQTGNNKYTLIIDEKKHIILGDVLLKLNILKPMEIDSDTYMNLINTNSYYDAYQKCINFITFKKRTEKETSNKLSSLHVSKKSADKIINQLYEKGYLNDEDYLKSYINDQINLTLNGPFKIKYNLSKMSFKEENIDMYLDGIDINWQERVEKIIAKKIKMARNISKNKLIQKLKIDLNNMGYNETHYGYSLKNIDYSDEASIKKEYQKYKNKLSKKYSGDKLEIMIKQKLYSLGYDVSNI